MSLTPPPFEDFSSLFARAKAGDSDAVAELFTRYAPHVQAVVRRRLSNKLRPRFDSVDGTQDVWLSFLKTSVERLDFPTETAFLAYLSKMAANKVGEEHRRRGAQKNDLNRERPIVGDTDPPARQPTPSQYAAADERWDGLVGGLPPTQRQVLEMLRDGYTHDEIGRRLGFHPKTVQRLLQRLKSRD